MVSHFTDDKKWKFQTQTYKKKKEYEKRNSVVIPVAIRLSPGASIPPGGRIKQLLGAVV